MNNKQPKHEQIVQAINQLTGRIERLEKRLGKPPDESSDAGTIHTEKKELAAGSKKRRKGVATILGFPFRTPMNAILSLLSTFFALVTGYVALRYDLSVASFSSLDASDPSETRFVVTNEGPFTISNVFYLCKYVPPHTSATPVIAYGVLVPNGPVLRLTCPHFPHTDNTA